MDQDFKMFQKLPIDEKLDIIYMELQLIKSLTH